MEESLHNALSELKRADHSIFVSLKYTRTVDVIKNIIERLINTIDFSFDVLFHYAKENKRLKDVPTIPRLRVEALHMLYPEDEQIQNFLDFYQNLKKINNARFDRAQEYRRHVTMTAHIDEGPVEITIDIVSDYFERTKEFVKYVRSMVVEEASD